MIGKLEIKNFKCFKDLSIPLNRLTVIAGANGVGKSTIIQSILLLRQAADQLRLLSDVGAVDSTEALDIPVRLNGPYRLMLGNTLSLTNAELESPELEISAHPLEPLGEDGIKASFTVDTLNSRMTITYRHSEENSRTMLKRQNGLSIFADQFHYLISERNGPRELAEASDQRVLTTGHAGEFTAHALSISENLPVHEALCLTEGSNLLKIQLEAWMRRIVPGVQIMTHPYPEMNRVRMSIGKSGAKINPLSPTNTGFGISYILPVVVSGLLAPKGSMLVIENPEAHLHPAAQSMIGYFLACVANAGVQVLVETHSENVINGVRLAALENSIKADDVGFLFLSPQPEDTQPELLPIAVDNLAELSSWPYGFFDQQSRDLGKILSLRRAKQNPSAAG